MGINDVIDAIAVKLHDTFGDGYTIYDEAVPQNLKEPAFFIFPLEPSLTKVIGNRYLNTLPFDIHYFGSSNRDAYTVLEQLNTEMEFIICSNGDLLHGTNMSSHLEDGVLHFFVNYNFHVIKVTEQEESMDGLSIDGSIRGE
ncbi:DUF6838 family protein [Robertmurraya massiliosenegalensis]|uniref:phage tail terminator family protein n=1 Tax=Robertmurraya TaxID=2837507 RepID=UPI0039A55764